MDMLVGQLTERSRAGRHGAQRWIYWWDSSQRGVEQGGVEHRDGYVSGVGRSRAQKSRVQRSRVQRGGTQKRWNRER